jgi:hypothetical protein
MQEPRNAIYNTVYHDELLRRSEYARLVDAVTTHQSSGFNLYRVVGQRLVNWGEALQQANAQRELYAAPDCRLRTGEIQAV